MSIPKIDLLSSSASPVALALDRPLFLRGQSDLVGYMMNCIRDESRIGYKTVSTANECEYTGIYNTKVSNKNQ